MSWQHGPIANQLKALLVRHEQLGQVPSRGQANAGELNCRPTQGSGQHAGLWLDVGTSSRPPFTRHSIRDEWHSGRRLKATSEAEAVQILAVC